MAEYTKEGHIAELRQMAAGAKAAGEHWERRWYLSLSWGNGAALAATGSAALTVINSSALRLNPVAPIAVAPSGWLFFIGLLAGAFIPYCWKRMVEQIPAWASVREDEVIENGEVNYTSDEDVVFSSDLLKAHEQHRAKWSRLRTTCEIMSVGAFTSGVAWALACLTYALIFR